VVNNATKKFEIPRGHAKTCGRSADAFLAEGMVVSLPTGFASNA